MTLQGMLQGSCDAGELAVATARLQVGPAAVPAPFPFWGWFVRNRLEAQGAAVAAREAEAAAAGGTAEALERLLQCDGYAALLEEFVFVCGAMLDRRVGPEGQARSRRDYLLFLEALRSHVAARLAPALPDKSPAALEALEARAESAAEKAVLRPGLFKASVAPLVVSLYSSHTCKAESV